MKRIYFEFEWPEAVYFVSHEMSGFDQTKLVS